MYFYFSTPILFDLDEILHDLGEDLRDLEEMPSISHQDSHDLDRALRLLFQAKFCSPVVGQVSPDLDRILRDL